MNLEGMAALEQVGWVVIQELVLGARIGLKHVEALWAPEEYARPSLHYRRI